MGFRFNRRIRVAPGITLNLGKSGVSTSIGTTGAKLTIGSNAVRRTVGLPGTGLFHTELLKPHTDGAEPLPEQRDRPRDHISVPIAIGIVLLVLAFLIGRFLLIGK